jgi:hypothetical protein
MVNKVSHKISTYMIGNNYLIYVAICEGAPLIPFTEVI